MPEQPKKKIMSDMIVRSASKPVVQKPAPKPSRPEREIPRAVLREEPEEFKNDYESDPIERIRQKYREDLGHPPRRKGCFLWIVIAVCIIALVIGIGGLFAHANVSIVPRIFSGDINATLSFSQSGDANAVFFATAVREFTDEIVVPATGGISQESRAAGKVRFYNAGTTARVVPAGARIVSVSGIAYQTAKRVSVPAKKGTVPGSVETNVTAVETGSQANIGPDDFTFADPKPFPDVTIRSAESMTGGSKSTDMAADPTAVAAAGESLKAKFSDAQVLAERIAQTIPDDFVRLPIDITANAPTVTVEPGHTDGVHVIARQTVGIIIVRKSDMARALGNRLNAEPAMPLMLSSLDGLTFISGTAISASHMPPSFSARITGTAAVSGWIDTESLRQSLAGMTRRESKTLIAADPAVASLRIRMRPPWRRVMPPNADDIEITVID